MNIWQLIFVIFFLISCISLLLWLSAGRSYQSTKSVAIAYDDWTNDRLLENLWGEHIHLGYYRSLNFNTDFRNAKVDFVHELVQWSGLEKLPSGSKVLDVGCGIGGAARILASDYGFDVLGVTISAAQVRRAQQLTPQGLSCRFEVMDALSLELQSSSFDAVWSVEAGPHMPDKQRYADELLRVLKPEGVMALADWNCRDPIDGEFSFLEKVILQQLLNQWAHPKFSSIFGFRENLMSSPYGFRNVETSDWTIQTLPSWFESILEGFRRPRAIVDLGPKAIFKAMREIPTILMMHWAFATGLMQFGVFRLSEESQSSSRKLLG